MTTAPSAFEKRRKFIRRIAVEEGRPRRGRFCAAFTRSALHVSSIEKLAVRLEAVERTHLIPSITRHSALLSARRPSKAATAADRGDGGGEGAASGSAGDRSVNSRARRAPLWPMFTRACRRSLLSPLLKLLNSSSHTTPPHPLRRSCHRGDGGAVSSRNRVERTRRSPRTFRCPSEKRRCSANRGVNGPEGRPLECCRVLNGLICVR